MDSIQNMIKQKMTEAVLGKIAGQFGLDASKASGLVSMALPMLLGGLGRNAQSKDGAMALSNALEGRHDGSILDHLQDAIGSQAEQDDGQKIVGHIFGDKLGSMTEVLGKSSGTDPDVAGKVLSSLAPVVLGQLGKSKREQGLGVSDLASMLGGEQKQAAGQLGGIMDLLDGDGKDSPMDDLLDIGRSFFK